MHEIAARWLARGACVMDDILVFGQSQEQYDTRLDSVLQRLSTSGITLNSNKCEFSKNKLIFLGHVINQNGISPTPVKLLLSIR